MRPLAFASALLLAAFASSSMAQSADYKIEGDGIPKPLTATPGSAARGKALLAKREAAPCLDCHAIKGMGGGDKAGGSKAPPLDGVGADLTAAQLRLSVADIGRVSRRADMPGFHTPGSSAPRLSAQEVEDIVAYLGTLRR